MPTPLPDRGPARGAPLTGSLSPDLAAAAGPLTGHRHTPSPVHIPPVSDLRVAVVKQQLRAHGFDITTASPHRIYRRRTDGTYDAMPLLDAIRLVCGRSR